MVIPQHAAESLTTCNFASSAAHFVAWLDDPIAEPLMISFGKQAAPLVVIEKNAFLAELFFQHLIFGSQVFDDFLLMPVNPAR